MGEVIQLQRSNHKINMFPSLEEITRQPERSASTPPRQTGQPSFLFHFPNGKLNLRTTQTGYKALILAKKENPDLPLEVESVVRPDGIFYTNAEAFISEEGGSDLLQIKKILDEWLVLHVYSSSEESKINGVYERAFFRVGDAPRPSPYLRYLLTIDFKQHGGLWCFGTGQDLEIARKLASDNDFVSVERERVVNGEWEGFAVNSRSQAVFFNQLKNADFWLKTENFWCDCHSGK